MSTTIYTPYSLQLSISVVLQDNKRYAIGQNLLAICVVFSPVVLMDQGIDLPLDEWTKYKWEHKTTFISVFGKH